MNQTYELAREIGKKLALAKFPFKVIYGPERIDRAKFDPVILLMRDRERSEQIGSAQGTQQNGRKMRTRTLPVKIIVYACDTRDGARIVEHEELCDYIVDALIVALEEWATEAKAGDLKFDEAAFLTPEELVTATGKPEAWPGVAFVLRFGIGRGVFKRDYLKQIRPTGTITGASNQADVRLKASDDPEVVPFGQQPEEP